MTFSPIAFDKWDEFGKDVVRAFLTNTGHVIVDNPNKYGIDLFSDKGGKLYRWEVEVKTGQSWSSADTFPYNTVSFLGRKEKWSSFPYWYCIVCAATEAICFAHSDVIFQEEFKVEKFIGERDEVQRFYHVPKELCYWTSSST